LVVVMIRAGVELDPVTVRRVVVGRRPVERQLDLRGVPVADVRVDREVRQGPSLLPGRPQAQHDRERQARNGGVRGGAVSHVSDRVSGGSTRG
jgi:hypothetical protein